MKYSLAFRVWHWLNAFVVLGLVGTVLLRKSFLSWRTNSEILLQKLSTMDITITAQQAKILAKAIRAGMWEWHIILGYALAFLVLYRVVLFFFDTTPKIEHKKLTLHKKLVRYSYFLFYFLLLFMSVSGLVMQFHELLSISKDKAHEIKEIHEFVYSFFLIYIPLHIMGILIAEHKNESGLISSMIHGKK